MSVNNELHDRLRVVLTALPSLLEDEARWRTLFIDDELPHVERLYTNLDDGYRVMLHRIWPCDAGRTLWHPHPWPSIVAVLEPARGVLYSTIVGRDERRPDLCVASSGSLVYSMPHPETHHRVFVQGGPSYSVMVVGPPWSSGRRDVKKTLGPLDDLTRRELFTEWRRRFPRLTAS